MGMGINLAGIRRTDPPTALPADRRYACPITSARGILA